MKFSTNMPAFEGEVRYQLPKTCAAQNNLSNRNPDPCNELVLNELRTAVTGQETREAVVVRRIRPFPLRGGRFGMLIRRASPGRQPR
jgi:hypothetical protein